MSVIKQIKIGSVTNDIRDDTKAPLDSPAFIGTPTAPTPAADDDSTRIATTAFVQALMRVAEAMAFKGTIGASEATVTELPANHKHGWTYIVATAGTYAGQTCEVGDMIICVTDGSTARDSDWTVIQSNLDGVVIGPASSTDAHVVTFNGASGKQIKDSGFTIGASVPAGAKFTDTKYSASSTSIGSASAGTAIKADDITAWDAGSTPTLGDPITATKITGWNAGSAPTLGAAISADDITGWDAGSMPTFSVANETLIITPGSAPSLQYTPKSIPNVTSVGAVPSLTKSDVSVPNVTDVGEVPALSYSEKTIPNISVTQKTVVTGITES